MILLGVVGATVLVAAFVIGFSNKPVSAASPQGLFVEQQIEWRNADIARIRDTKESVVCYAMRGRTHSASSISCVRETR